jgi:hypothetical protein
MRIIIGILIGVLLVGALIWPGWIWGHPIWGPWPKATPTPAASQPAAPAAEQPSSQPTAQDPLLPSLTALGFNSREQLIQFFAMTGVSPDELHGCPGEVACVAITREKDINGHIQPFKMTNPTSMTFDGWRAASQPGINWDGNQAKVPPGTWYVEGITIRPWRR